MESYFGEAQKLGIKCYKKSVSKGEYPYLPVLDEIMPFQEANVGIDIGLSEIPLEFIIGTKTRGRTRSFARNFMPIVDDESEFAAKWKRLCKSHLEEGIHDPVLVWEYMNRFYVQEGNKRVSVLKYFGAVTVPAQVKRILPKRNGDEDVERYYELLDFCKVTGISFLEFTKSGSYKELLNLLGKTTSQLWTEEERKIFSSVYFNFEKVFYDCGGRRMKLAAPDAFLAYIRIYGYQRLANQSSEEIKKTISKIKAEIVLQKEDSPIDLKLEPEEKAKIVLPSLIRKKTVRIAFFYSRDISVSRWSANHDLGRQHIQDVFAGKIETAVYIRDDTLSVDENLRKIIQEGAKIIFVTESKMIDACVRAAIEHPEVDILNCSLNKPHRFIRTYYPRMYEAKFITGAIAGALDKKGKIGYICKYPIYGMIAEINAFARGVGMVNPDAKICLEWSSVNGINSAEKNLKEQGIHLISYRDFYDQKSEAEVVFGLTDTTSGSTSPLVLPVWNWGKFYESITESVLKGTYRSEYKKTNRSLNYYWGMSSGAVDIIFSGRLPQSVKYLGNVLCKAIRSGIADPFYYPHFEKYGQIRQEKCDRPVNMEDIIIMDTLEDNVIGTIPEYSELEPKVRELVDEIGVESAKQEISGVAGKEQKNT